MSKKSTLTAEVLASVAHLSSAKAAKVLGVGKTTVTDARAREDMRRDRNDDPTPVASAESSFSFEQKGNGSLLIESQDSIPQTEETIHERMRARGFDPEKYAFTYRFSEWQAQRKGGAVITMYAARAGAVERTGGKAQVPTIEYDKLVEVIERAGAPERGELAGAYAELVPNTFVFNFADPQIGKTDLNGGTEETVARFMSSLEHAEALLTAEPATEIVWADLGDGIENFCTTTSQRQTNDRNLVEQVRILRRLQVEGISRLLEFAPVRHISVPSNHSQNRVGFQQPASTAHDDWGLEVQLQLEEAFRMAGVEAYDGLTFHRPAEHMESLSYRTVDGTTLGFVHGHRSNSQNGLEQWWAGQTLGRQPTADADILLVGHFHNFSVRSVGNGRYIITTPSLDNGSSWFTVSRGSVATAGVLTMRVEAGKFRDLLIV